MTSTDADWVDPANVPQFQAWDAGEGVFWADQADLFEQTLGRYDATLLRTAGIRDGDRVLDVGCGTGATTRRAAELAGRGSALGVDLSSPMLGVADRLATDAGVSNARFEQADVQIHPFPPGSFDVAVSRTGCMFFADPVAAFTNIARALRPAGRLALLVWQPPVHNEWFTALTRALAVGRELPLSPPDAPGPFSMSEPDRVSWTLARAGFATPEFRKVEEPMYFGPDPETAQRFVLGILGWLVELLDAAMRQRALAALRADLDAHHTGDGVTYGSAVWLVSTHRIQGGAR